MQKASMDNSFKNISSKRETKKAGTSSVGGGVGSSLAGVISWVLIFLRREEVYILMEMI